MNICVLQRGDLSIDYGPTVVVRNLVEEWKRRHNVTLVSYSRHPGSLGGLQWSDYPAWLAKSMKVRGELLRNQDIVFDPSLTYPILVRLKLWRVPIVSLMHDDIYMEAAMANRQILARVGPLILQDISARLSDLVITVSGDSARRLDSRYNCKSKMAVIANGVRTEKFRPLSLRREKMFLFVGHMRGQYERKGIPTLLEAFSKLVKDFPKVVLATAGTRDPMFLNDIKVLGIEQNVVDLGFLEEDNLAQWYNKSSALILPSRFDGYGLVVNEAMSCGTPVVVSNQVGAASNVLKAGAGLVFPAGSSYSLYECLRTLIGDEQLVSKFGSAGIAYATTELDWRYVSEKYISHFKVLIDAGAQHRPYRESEL